MMEFIQVDIATHPDFTEILIAELSENNYDSFWEKNEGEFTAYVERQFFDEAYLKNLHTKYPDAAVSYQFEGLESKNWNEEWEKNFQPIVVANTCYVRSTFHEHKPEYPLEIIIEPKMSFGTGHHATTSMMIEQMLALALLGKKVMDVGTGSGILAITAAKMGATEVFAFDIDSWSVDNTTENLELNSISNVAITQGTIAAAVPGTVYDVVLANITRNILLEEIPSYLRYLQPGGELIISGFYKEDISAFDPLSKQYKLEPLKTLIRDNWASIMFRKTA